MSFGFIPFVNYIFWTYTLWTYMFWNYIFCRAPSRDTAKALSVSARYVEASLKLGYSMHECIKRGYKLADEFEDLMVVLLAHMRYLQEEFGTLVVQGSFGNRTHLMLRNIQQHTTCFGPSVLENVKVAATLAALQQEQQVNQPSQQNQNLRFRRFDRPQREFPPRFRGSGFHPSGG